MKSVKEGKMPYIDQKSKDDLAYRGINLDEIVGNLTLDKPGEIVWLIYGILYKLWTREFNFKAICVIRGIVISLISEYDRRMEKEFEIYEQKKLNENGDV